MKKSINDFIKYCSWNGADRRRQLINLRYWRSIQIDRSVVVIIEHFYITYNVLCIYGRLSSSKFSL